MSGPPPAPALMEPNPTDRTKHAACDECRTRKLKCSGDPTGCERCSREGIPCQYSLTKPMGRPRKRRAVTSEDVDWNRGTELAAPVEFDFGGLEFLEFGIGAGMEAWLPGEGEEAGDVRVGDIHIGAEGIGWPEGEGDGGGLEDLMIPGWAANSPLPWALPHPASTSPPPPRTTTTFSPATPAADIPPSPHPPPHIPPSTPPHSFPFPFPPSSCAHLPTLLTHLTRLPHLPALFPLPLPPLRATVATISALLACPTCSPPVPSATGMQTTLLLVTAIPHISSHYARLLAAIDAEAAGAAGAAGGVKRLRMGEVGNPALEGWHTGTRDCPMGVEVEVEAGVWRGMMRGVVVKEVGVLRGVVEAMDVRGRGWHERRWGGDGGGGVGVGMGGGCAVGTGGAGCFGLTVVAMTRMAVEGVGVGGGGRGGVEQGTI